MNKLMLIVCLFFVQQGIAQIKVDKDFKTLKVTGDMKSLSVVGEDRDQTIIELSDGSNSSDNIKISKLLNKLIVDIQEPELDFVIRVPKGVNIIIEPDDIVFEGLFDIDKDQRLINIENLSGMIDVTTDGYMVNLLKNSSDMSVVSYLNITADSISISDGMSIVMDSYWGDVVLGAKPPLDAHIKLRAKQGLVQIDSLIALSDELILLKDNISVIVGDGLSDIVLHSEKGGHVLLDLESMKLDMDEILESDNLINGYVLSQNEPNPWKKETKIEYYLPESGRVFFEFYDVEGKILYSVTKDAKKGRNKLTVKKKMVSNQGIIYYTMKSGDFQSTRKMIHVD